jgi:hypothetical protein
LVAGAAALIGLAPVCWWACRRPAWAQALAALVQAASKQLPKQKGAQLAAQKKQTMMRLQRTRNKDTQHDADECHEDEEEESMFELPLPHEVTLRALSLLDPVSLAGCQCVCRCVISA